jgi:CspA family cold shock protein
MRTFTPGINRGIAKASRFQVETDSVEGLRPEKRKALELIQKTGIVGSWFNGESGYGFIHPDDGGEGVFVHHTGIATHAKDKSLKAGVRVSYEVVRRRMAGMWAKDVYTTD